jgi:tryptophan 2,3-dioxygenase
MPAPTYWDYLHLDQLLALQGGLEGDETQLMPDELHFIIVHQAFELWFKLSLRELRLARDHLAAPRVPEENVPYVVHHLRRVNAILELAVDQFRVMETLTPQDFLAFRDKLISASGFQSFQMREIEIVLGLEDAQRLKYAGTDPLDHISGLAKGSPGGKLAVERIARARNEQTLRAALHDWIYRTPIQGSSPEHPGDARAVERFLVDYFAAMQRSNAEKVERMIGALGSAEAIRAKMADAESAARSFLFAEEAPEAERQRLRRIRAGVLFIESYRELPLLAWPRLLIDTIVELEEQLVLWRTRHARMVERIIGRRVGTGGSSGVDYLDQTTRYRIFDELWAVRTILLQKEALPALDQPEAYGFAR